MRQRRRGAYAEATLFFFSTVFSKNHHQILCCLDIRERGFWNGAQDAFFYVRVFQPNASSNTSISLQSAFRRHEQAKKREYGERVCEIEHGVFTPLVLFTTKGLGIYLTANTGSC